MNNKPVSRTKVLTVAALLAAFTAVSFLSIFLLDSWSKDRERNEPKLSDCSKTLCGAEVDNFTAALKKAVPSLAIESVAYNVPKAFLDGETERIDIILKNGDISDDTTETILELAWKSEVYPLNAIGIDERVKNSKGQNAIRSIDTFAVIQYNAGGGLYDELTSRYGERRPGQLQK